MNHRQAHTESEPHSLHPTHWRNTLSDHGATCAACSMLKCASVNSVSVAKIMRVTACATRHVFSLALSSSRANSERSMASSGLLGADTRLNLPPKNNSKSRIHGKPCTGNSSQKYSNQLPKRIYTGCGCSPTCSPTCSATGSAAGSASAASSGPCRRFWLGCRSRFYLRLRLRLRLRHCRCRFFGHCRDR